VSHEARMALAFYREGLGLNNIAYKCLSLFKVLNVGVGGGQEQIAWINILLPHVSEFAAKQHAAELAAIHSVVCAFLYGSNRLAGWLLPVCCCSRRRYSYCRPRGRQRSGTLISRSPASSRVGPYDDRAKARGEIAHDVVSGASFRTCWLQAGIGIRDG